MGKYSLDAFERYPLVKLRPEVKQPAPGQFRLLEVAAGESVPGEAGADTVLRLTLTGDIAADCAAICRTGASSGALAGVLVEDGGYSGAALKALVQAYRTGFGDAHLLAEPEVAARCQSLGLETGLWLDLSKGVLNLRREIAMAGLARRWERCPAYIQAGRPLSAEELDAARRWHASGADTPAPLGARMALRRMMFPRDLTAGGPMPLRLWWQNVGTAPLYAAARVLLELRKDGERFPIEVAEPMPRLGLGDSTFNTTAQLPQALGAYELWCGLEAGGKRLALAMEGETREGLYRLGTITLDDIPRPYLQTLWEEQYADGYYPLEDPAQPE